MILAAILIAGGVSLTPPTVPDCARFDVCKYQPGYNGPLMPTWNTPGTYGGWTTNPVLCDPVTYQCRQVVSGS
ncbi:Uncharacterised protein [Mycobacteroides abscessus subsp. abscessus]|nr:Uncharacterised protein [Mycobacteroides abscessus subsp. abscessus]